MIVGTAGHVDHGKTALVKALTGIQADRLAEERERGMSIDLGFAYAALADGSVVGFVDVPGHERFMRNMLAGASGIDLVLLVVAADDGIMPQTREHLAVVELLGLKKAVVALTKCDLVERTRVEQVSGKLRELMADGPLANSEVLPVSSVTGEGIEVLRGRLNKAITSPNTPPQDAPVRFSIDRSFTLPGAGTVITGVVAAGRLKVGEQFVISPRGTRVRVRSLRAQSQPATIAGPGNRCGVALGGRVDSGAVRRGDWLIDPALHCPTERIDAELRLVPDEPRALRHWTAVRFHHGAAEVGAHLALLQDDPIRPGEVGRVQIALDQPIAAAVGDRFVVRSQDGSRTVGGGKMIDLSPPRRRRKQARRLAQLDAMALADAAESLAAQLEVWPWFVEKEKFFRQRAFGKAQEERVLSAVPHRHAALDQVTYVFGETVWKGLEAGVLEEVRQFHAKRPQLLGSSLRRLQAVLKDRLPEKAAHAILAELVSRGKLVLEGGFYRAPDHRLGLDRVDTDAWHRIRPLLGGEARFRPPRVEQLAELLQERHFEIRRVLKAMAQQRAVVEVAKDQFFLRKTMTEVACILAKISEEGENGQFSVAELRDHMKNGRKTTIQLLEHFDRRGITLRRGDVRDIDRLRLQQFVSSGDSAG